ncbi:MAG: RidA family protein [Polyangiaceae bacterium]|jgi:2-iminobutanoate/2-iminopropanoate deaminase|nr:RidA family protein [Polyangiaceae bacterium]MBK8937910.1 RidA family protein [Polyangiaceae bacterium]
MPKTSIHTDLAPAAIGPYAQATKAGGFLFTSGQIALDPATGQMVSGGTEAEARQVLKNLLHVLSAGGAAPDDVVKTTIFLADLDDFALVNGIYGEAFGKSLPARSTVQAARLPRGARVEIEAIAYVGDK